MNLYDEFFAIAGLFNQLGVRYAVVGGIAMAFHGKPRFTRDIDILVMPEDLEVVRTALARLGYEQFARPWRFRRADLTLHRFVKIEGKDELTVDVLPANTSEHRGVIANALKAESKAGIVRVATRKDIVWMKKSRNSDQDRVDIRELENDEDRKGRKNGK
jgi:hypothetical protein